MSAVRRRPVVADLTLVTGGAMVANAAGYLLQLLAGRWLGVAGYSGFASLLAVQLLCAVPALALQNVVARELVRGVGVGALRGLQWRCAVIVAAVAAMLVAPVTMLLNVGVGASAAALGAAPVLVLLSGEEGILQGSNRFRALAVVLGAAGIARVAPAVVVLALGGGAAAALTAAAVGIAGAAVLARVVTDGAPTRWHAKSDRSFAEFGAVESDPAAAGGSVVADRGEPSGFAAEFGAVESDPAAAGRSVVPVFGESGGCAVDFDEAERDGCPATAGGPVVPVCGESGGCAVDFGEAERDGCPATAGGSVVAARGESGGCAADFDEAERDGCPATAGGSVVPDRGESSGFAADFDEAERETSRPAAYGRYRDDSGTAEDRGAKPKSLSQKVVRSIGVLPVLRAAQVQAALMALSSADLIVVRMVLGEADASRYALGAIAAKIAFWLPQAVGVVLYPRMAQPAHSARAVRDALAVLSGIGMVAVLGAAVAAPLAPLFAGRDYAPIEGLLWLFASQGALLAVLQGALLSAIAGDRTSLAMLTWLGLAVEVIVIRTAVDSVSGAIVAAVGVAAVTTVLVAATVSRTADRGAVKSVAAEDDLSRP
ncbi:polysaccharide biosynthesis protein [Nocardia arthritidis]|uniref:Polysaccharide biosynthesis protein n=1 Tax=Nocardia arthritidis TaxID=228602 RepID=A0A6G9YU24_9NOCA|nr:polysaccharide biosynthesis protein [Nocardia arthritidis]